MSITCKSINAKISRLSKMSAREKSLTNLPMDVYLDAKQLYQTGVKCSAKTVSALRTLEREILDNSNKNYLGGARKHRSRKGRK